MSCTRLCSGFLFSPVENLFLVCDELCAVAPTALQFPESAATALGITRLERKVEVSAIIKFLQVLQKSAAKERPKLMPTLKGKVGRAQPSSLAATGWPAGTYCSHLVGG